MKRREPPLLTPLVAGLVLVGTLSACGGDDEPSDASIAPATTATSGADSTDAPATTGGSDTTAGGDTTGAAPTGNEEFCGPMEELANYNASQPDVDPEADWATLQADILSRSDEGFQLYDDALAVAPEDVAGDLQTLRGVTEEVIAAVEEATTLEEFAAGLDGLVTEEVSTATVNVDTYIQETCGFSLTQ